MRLRLSTSARIALANSALLAACFGVMLMLVTWLAGHLMVSHVEESVAAELQILQSELAVHGLPGVVALIDQRIVNVTPNHDRIYRLENAAGLQLAGNLNEWPAAAGPEQKVFRFGSRRYPGQTQVVARWTALPAGTRLLVGFDDIEIHQVRQDLRDAALLGLVGMLLVSLTAGFLITRAALRPVEAIRLSAERIMQGELGHRIHVRGHGDDFDRLCLTLNAMLARIESLIASLKGATDNIAHDLRSPLTRHRVRLESALQSMPSAHDFEEWLERSLADVDQVLATCQSLLRIASVESGLLRREFEPCDMARLIEDVCELMDPLTDERQVLLEATVTSGPTLEGHRHLLFQMLVNLLDNAIKFSPAEGRITLSAGATGVAWVITVADEGEGIPVAARERVFERLYRLDSARHAPGLGLGLSMVKACVELHGGTISIGDNSPGARVTVSLPLAARRPDQAH